MGPSIFTDVTLADEDTNSTYLIFVTDTRTVSVEKKSVMWRNLKFLHMWINFTFHHMTDVKKSEISFIYVYNLWYFVAFYAVLLQKVLFF